MIESLESRYRVEECCFDTIFGSFQGRKIYASRKVAEKIEIQTRYAAELYNVDVRQDQRYMAEKDIFPCGDRDESRFSPDFEVPLSTLEIQVAGDPEIPRDISRVQVISGHQRRARRYGLEPTFSRSGRFKSMASKSYWSHGMVNHKDGAMIPEGRVLIDTAKSFVYTEGSLKGD